MSRTQRITVKRRLIVPHRSQGQHFARLSRHHRKASVTVQISTECSKKKKRERESELGLVCEYLPGTISSSVNMSMEAHSRSLLGRKTRICCSDDVTAWTTKKKKENPTKKYCCTRVELVESTQQAEEVFFTIDFYVIIFSMNML